MKEMTFNLTNTFNEKKPILIISIFLLFFSYSCLFAKGVLDSTSRVKESYESLNEKADELIDNGEYEDAIWTLPLSVDSLKRLAPRLTYLAHYSQVPNEA